MEKICAKYETIFVCDMAVGEDGIKALVEKFTGLIADNGTIIETNEWGKRKLAYLVDDKNEGYYVLVSFTAPADFPAELERIYNITDGIIRSIVIKVEE